MKPEAYDSRMAKTVHQRAPSKIRPFAVKRSKVDLEKSTEEKEILKALIDARNEWLDSVASFENVYEEDLVDYYTYKMKACEARYEYFIKKVKDMGLSASIPQAPDTLRCYGS